MGLIVRKKTMFILIIAMLLETSLTGCFGPTVYRIYYGAHYSTTIDIELIKETFLDNNITIYEDVIYESDPENNIEKFENIFFRFSDSSLNESVPSIEGDFGNAYEGPVMAFYSLHLDEEKYPPSESLDVVEGYKPDLEIGRAFIEDIIFNATGLKPLSGSYDTTGDVNF